MFEIVLLLSLETAHYKMPVQAPRRLPSQSPVSFIMPDQAPVLPAVKSCPCSPQCTCGCNEGKPCSCSSRLVPVQSVPSPSFQLAPAPLTLPAAPLFQSSFAPSVGSMRSGGC